ncbi:MAG: hypothetical protein M1826_006942 [Phylliscum demangeonii]|nr:MAG: hypothetical protein M1826_006942 [Phylliscum demangeonii]
MTSITAITTTRPPPLHRSHPAQRQRPPDLALHTSPPPPPPAPSPRSPAPRRKPLPPHAAPASADAGTTAPPSAHRPSFDHVAPGLRRRPLDARGPPSATPLPGARLLFSDLDLGLDHPTTAPAEARSTPTPPWFPTAPDQPHHLTLLVPPDRDADGHARDLSSVSDESVGSTTTTSHRTRPSVFGWKGPSPGPASSVTSYSNQTASPIGSPKMTPVPAPVASSRAPPEDADADADEDDDADDPALATPPGKMDEMEEELREISTELASSIRREMDLEDLVDRFQAEAETAAGPRPDQAPAAPGKRTSDYFSDAGTSSAKQSVVAAEAEEAAKEVEVAAQAARAHRAAQQAQAQLRLRLTQKIQAERLRRKALEHQVRRLEEHAPLPPPLPSGDVGGHAAAAAAGRIKQLEAALDETRRRVSEERRMKENYEDLLTALRAEIDEHRNERDNLRDEVVPQLRARLEGLESAAAEHQRLTYDHTRMQQELQALTDENAALHSAREMQRQLHQQLPPPPLPWAPIAEDPAASSASASAPTHAGLGRSRSHSVARRPSTASTAGPGPTRPPRPLSSAHSERDPGSRSTTTTDAWAERVHDISAQRDALHRALRSLLERQEHQTHEHTKRVRALEAERDRAVTGGSARRRGFDREVGKLRQEMEQLRRRADDALDQTWRCEQGLGGLQKDLERAEQETAALRTLLLEHDVVVPRDVTPTATTRPAVMPTTPSAELEKAYGELQTTHALAAARIQTLEAAATAAADAAEAPDGLAAQLRASARRVEELSGDVRAQMAANGQLREKLADAVARGERDQQSAAARITDLQAGLRALEARLTAAQRQSEASVAQHEEEVRRLRESHRAQLQRMTHGSAGRASLGAGAVAPASSEPGLFATRSPRLAPATRGVGLSMTEPSRAEQLERRVLELERALADADRAMEEVVGRMNLAQMEVMELQSERDEAMRRTRRLQANIQHERQKVKALIV